MKKNRSDEDAVIVTKIPLQDLLNDHPVIQWTTEHARTIVLMFLAFIGLVLILYRFIEGNTVQSETDYLAAERDFLVFQNREADNESQANAFSRLEKIMDQHPDLHAKYDGLIAQTLLIRNQTTEAKKYEEIALARIESDHLPDYTDYAKTTLLINEQQYPEALKQAASLKHKILERAATAKDHHSNNSILFALNLLRIAILQQQLGLDKEELSTWQEWKAYAKPVSLVENNIDPNGFRNILSLFEEGNVSLLSYIEAREKILKS